MAKKKTAIVDIRLEGLDTIQDLENELNKINTQLKDVDINSNAFDDLSQRAQVVKGRLNEINTEISPIGFQQKEKAVKEFGEALTGAFQIGAGAAVAFGGKTGEELQKLITQVAGVYAALDGLIKVSKAFQTENIRGLKAVMGQFGILTKSVKISSATMRTAMLTIPILALIAGVAALILNWDKLTSAIKRNREARKLDAQIERGQKELDIEKQRLSLFEEGIKSRIEIARIVGNERDALVAEIDLLDEKVRIMDKENELANKLFNRQKLIEKSAKEEKETRFENLKYWQALGVTSPIYWLKMSEAAKVAGEEAEAREKIKDLVLEALVADKERIENGLKSLELQKRILRQGDVDRLKKESAELENQLELLRVGQDTQQAQAMKEVEIINSKIKAIKLEAELSNNLSKEDAFRVNQLNKQRDLYQRIMSELIIEGEAIDENGKKIQNNQAALNKYGQLMLTNEKTLKGIYFDAIQNQANLTEAQEIEIKNLEIQTQVLIIQNNLRKQLLEKEIKALINQREYSARQRDIQNAVGNQNKALANQTAILENNAKLADEYNRLFDLTLEGYRKYVEYEKESKNLDLFTKRLNAYEKEIKFIQLIPSELKITREAYEGINDVINRTAELEGSKFKNIQEFGEFVKDSIGEATKDLSGFETNSFRISEKLLEAKAGELAIIKAIKENENSILQTKGDNIKAQDRILELQEETRNNQIDLINKQIELSQLEVEAIQKKLEDAKNLEERVRLTQELNNAENTMLGFINERQGIENELNAIAIERVQNANEISTIENDIKNNLDEVVTTTKQITLELIKQSQIYTQLQGVIEKYQEEIQASQQLIGQSFEMLAAFQDRKAEEAARRLADLQAELSELENQDKERGKRLLELERELKDANGERYDELLALIEKEKQAKIDADNEAQANKDIIEAQIAAQEDAKMEAEYQAAVWRKAAAIIDATIASALAVVQALPNVVLAAIVAGLGAAQIATIAAQKLPPRPKAEEGMLVGATHSQGGIPIEAESGEFIVNKKATSEYLPVIEAINNQGRKKYAEGGMVNTIRQRMGQNEIIDYDLLAEKITKSIQPVVSVREITKAQRRVKIIEGNAGI